MPTMRDGLLRPACPRGTESIQWHGLYAAALGLALAETARHADAPLVVVMREQRNLEILQNELAFFLRDARLEVFEFPAWECLPYDLFSPHPDIISQRLRLLARLPRMQRGVVLTTDANLMQRLPPKEYLAAHGFSLKLGEQISLEAFRERLQCANYAAVNQVVSPGEFAVRGGLIDVFPMGAAAPFRLDLFDDEVESIRRFDPETQRSKGRVDSLELLPAREFPMHAEAIETFRRAFRREFDGDPRGQKVYADISEARLCAGAEFFFPLFFEHTASLFDYLDARAIFAVEDDLQSAAGAFAAEVNDRYANAGVERRVLSPHKLYLPPDELRCRLKKFSRIVLHAPAVRAAKTKIWRGASKPPQTFPVDARARSPHAKLLAHLRACAHRILLSVETLGRCEAMQALLTRHGIATSVCDDYADFSAADAKRIGICVSPLERGMLLEDAGVEIITESQLYGEKVFQRRRRSTESRDPESIIRSLAELNPGDPVVHIEHGVGRYRGLESVEVDGEATEFLKIEYQNGDLLSVPVLNLNLVSRFVGGSSEHAPLHRLGGEAWTRAKKRARDKAYDVAAELLEVDAMRAARGGQSFKVPQPEYDDFVARFEFEETPDQLRAIDDVLNDLRARAPMDRLVCGDVGFGKTEVALRAALVAVFNHTQVALLAPTTLLAQQHHRTFVERFAGLPVEIELLSRFNSAAVNKKIIENMRAGKVDIVIGTHKLLQKNIHFAKLGLLIIDEEHRFGVRQKEKIKRMRSCVDILTLTATPIPRTLNVALSGLRKISVIATPPQARLSIKTFVRESNDELIREACLREIRRGGQVYFLHNDIRGIERAAIELAELVPEAEIRVAHGRMQELTLERVMRDFYHRRFNVLLCTTIIESGIDVPLANTMIINRAERFGLAQLHQLRGRVGRSHHQAFAWLLIDARDAIGDDAKKRLNTIAAMEELGAGFALASHDLEIRGAGELLGETQSGSIDGVGFSLYAEYLNQAVASIKENKIPFKQIDERGARIELHVPALFPENYLPNAHTRLILYKRIAGAPDDAALHELQIESVDRFGLLPQAAKNLFKLAALRLRAEHLGVREIEIGKTGGKIELAKNHRANVANIISLAEQLPENFRLADSDAFVFSGDLEDHETRLDKVEGLLALLADLDSPSREQLRDFC